MISAASDAANARNPATRVVRGTSDYDKAAAERVAEILKPWDIRCKIVDAAEVNKPRPISPEAAPVWIGLDPGRAEAARIPARCHLSTGRRPPSPRIPGLGSQGAVRRRSLGRPGIREGGRPYRRFALDATEGMRFKLAR